MPKKHKPKTKVPQLITTALLFAYPICLAQYATSSAFGITQSPLQSQTESRLLGNNSLGQSSQTISASSSPSSVVEYLYSKLSDYQNQLLTLYPQLTTLQIEALETKISLFQTQISNLNSLYNTYLPIQDAYNNAVTNQTNAYSVLNTSQTQIAQQKSLLTSIQTTLQTLEANLSIAQQELQIASTALAQAHDAYNQAFNNYASNYDLSTQTVAYQTYYQAYENYSITFDFPQGATVTSVYARYEAIHYAPYGADVSETVFNLLQTQNTIYANNSTFGDPAPGWHKQLIVYVTYSQDIQIYTPNQSLYEAFLQAEANLQQAEQTYSEKSINKDMAQSEYDSALNNLESLNNEIFILESAYDSASIDYSKYGIEAETNYALLQNVSQELNTAYTGVDTTMSEIETLLIVPETPTPTPTDTTKPTESPKPTIEPVVPKPTQSPTPTESSSPSPTPTPTSTPEPEVIIIPEEMTPSEAEQLKEEALTVLETAERGSPEYEQALDALYAVAQQDDIEVSEELAAIPLVGNVAVALTDLVNALGNAGSDMSPKVREDSEKVVISAIVAGQIAQVASGAAVSASASATRRTTIK